MTHASAPYAEPEPLPELVEECRCVEAECSAHGVDLHRPPRADDHPAADPPVIDEGTGHLLDGLPDYGC